MAGFAGVSAVGKSIERVLSMAFADDEPIDGETTVPLLVRAADMVEGGAPQQRQPALSILLYRVDFTKTMRSTLTARSAEEGRAHLPLDLHYLLSPWADNAEHEQLIVGRTLQVLESLGQLSGPTLDATGGFTPQETVTLLMEELSTDDLMRTFEALQVEFRLSLPYLARVLVVSGQDDDAHPPTRVLSVTTSTAGASG